MEQTKQDFFGTESIGRILWKIAPPVMLGQLILALYNIVDSFFLGRYADDALTAVTVIYPLQNIIVSLAVGTGVGVNTYMARKYARGETEKAKEAAGTGMLLAILSYGIFAGVSTFLLRPYVMLSAKEPGAVADAITYGRIVCIGSLFTFLEGIFTKVHQAGGQMRLPMVAQVAGALTNVIFDPLLIFGIGPFPELGIAGAAYATVAGQFMSALITGFGGMHRIPRLHKLRHNIGRIYFYGYSSILMQALYSVYIVVLNAILAGFSDAAVTVLGLYYKAQSFFFIPLIGLQTCIVPVISFNYARANYGRCRETMRKSLFVTVLCMSVGILCFLVFPEALMRLFSKSEQVLQIGKVAFPIIGCSFISASFSLMLPVFFQAIGRGGSSTLIILTRQIFVMIPVFYAFSRIGLNATWFAFPIAETAAGGLGLLLYFHQIHKWKMQSSPQI